MIRSVHTFLRAKLKLRCVDLLRVTVCEFEAINVVMKTLKTHITIPFEKRGTCIGDCQLSGAEALTFDLNGPAQTHRSYSSCPGRSRNWFNKTENKETKHIYISFFFIIIIYLLMYLI